MYSLRKALAAVIVLAMAAGAVSGSVFAAEEGGSVRVSDAKGSAAATQKLIDARPYMQRPMEALSRGLIAVKKDDSVYLSWRWLGTELHRHQSLKQRKISGCSCS